MWLEQACPVCRRTEAESVLPIDDPGAPAGGSQLVRCIGCGMIRLDRRPAEAALAQYYADGYNAFVGRTRGQLKQRVWDLLRDLSGGHTALTRRLSVIRRAAYGITSRLVDINLDLTGRQRAEILDVGCGYGD